MVNVLEVTFDFARIRSKLKVIGRLDKAVYLKRLIRKLLLSGVAMGARQQVQSYRMHDLGRAIKSFSWSNRLAKH